MIVSDLVSVIVPVHNRARLVVEAVESAVAQDWRPIEIVVVDDGSDDDTPASLASLVARHPSVVRTIRRARPGGPGVAREAGRLEIRGEFVQYLDSDDLLAPRKIRLQIEALRARPGSELCWGREETLFEAPGGRVRRVRKTMPVVDRLFPTLLHRKLWQTFNPLYRRALVDRIGPWSPQWSFQDWEYDGRTAAAGAVLCFADVATGSLRRGDHRHVSAKAHLRRQIEARATVYEAMLVHARACGVPSDAPEMSLFARRLFHVARACGALGRAERSRRLFDLARRASPTPRGRDWSIYDAAAGRIGWRAAGVLSEGIDRLRAALGRRGR